MNASETELTIRQTQPLEIEATRSSEDVELTEAKMRRALGLDGPSASGTLTIKAILPRPGAAVAGAVALSPPRQRTDSADRAASQASTMSPLRERVAELERQLATERQRHDEARRLLQQAERTVHALEARSQHNAVVQQEELQAERRATVTAQRAMDEVVFESQQLDRSKQPAKIDEDMADLPAAKRPTPRAIARSKRGATALASSVGEPTEPKKRGRTRPLPEPKPVRWWTPSYRAKSKG